MASATLVPPYSSHTSPPLSKVSKSSPFLASLSTSPISYSKTPIFRSLTFVNQQGLTSWNGLRKNGITISLKSLRFEKKRKNGRKGVYASLFGVGAPEALVIGVVALLVFGPKGLAEIAKNLGKTLRAFQPTIRELQEVSREFKSTLEKEIGLDELENTARGSTANMPALSATPPPRKSKPKATAAAATEEGAQVSELPVAASGQDDQVSETPIPATGEEAQVSETPIPATGEDAQVSETPAPATGEDAQVSETLVSATGEDSVVAATPVADTTEDSQVVATTPGATTTEDSQAVAPTPAATTNDSQPTIKSNYGEEVGAGMHLSQKSEDVN